MLANYDLRTTNYKSGRNYTLPHRWAMWMSVDGDLRFLSHHDMMHTIERLVIRAGLQLRYTQGFNPHPVLSLVFPRPVGVRSRCDLFVFSLEEQIDKDRLLETVNLHVPAGMKFIEARELADSQTPQPVQCDYELVVTEDCQNGLPEVIEQWQQADTCLVERTKPAKGRRSKPRSRTIDLKQLVCDLRSENGKLFWKQVPSNSLWAKPSEVLNWLGLPPEEIAKVVRTHVTYEGL